MMREDQPVDLRHVPLSKHCTFSNKVAKVSMCSLHAPCSSTLSMCRRCLGGVDSHKVNRRSRQHPSHVCCAKPDEIMPGVTMCSVERGARRGECSNQRNRYTINCIAVLYILIGLWFFGLRYSYEEMFLVPLTRRQKTQRQKSW